MEVALNAKTRETGKQISKQYRRNGLVPGVFYGNKMQPISILTDPLSLRTIIYTDQTKIVKLSVEGDSKVHDCVLKDVTFHPVTDKIVHFDLLGLTAGQKITVEVPIKTVGQAAGVKVGGTLSVVIRKVKLKTLAEDLPEFIEVDVSHLDMGQSVKLDSIRNPKWEFEIKGNPIVCSVNTPRVKKEIGK